MRNVLSILVHSWLISTTVLALTISANGQNLGLKTGIYNSFYNFLKNQPVPAQVLVNYRIQHDDKHDPIYPTDTLEVVEATSYKDRYFISADDIRIRWKVKAKNIRILRRSMWGFYDGRYIYVSSNNYTLSSFVYFSRLLEYGRYSYFYGIEELRNKSAGVISGLAGTVPIRAYYILDTEMGDFYKVTPAIVAEILEEYPDLHEQFEKEKQDKEILLKYIRAYNARYEREIR